MSKRGVVSVSLPASGDFRQLRARTKLAVGIPLALVRNPVLACVGASDLAFNTVSHAVTGSAPGPTMARSGTSYAEMTSHGEAALARVRSNPDVAKAMRGLEDATDEFNRRFEYIVDELNDLSEEALGRFSLRREAARNRAAELSRRVAERLRG
ncbi:hypothetical protein BKA01_006832 [Pseudonocardia eucalypti]|uniref:hypothetical protein n=1 Tax=Pseudonocardia eucalypti TaxID=648755 RepID=UPI001617EE32|nr:hypothetical protein [Pseudonocardia eucalypti]